MMSHGLGDTGDAFALPFLDLHYFQNNSSGGAGSGSGGGLTSLAGTTGTTVHTEARQGLALDLACVSSAVPTKVVGSTSDGHSGAPMPRERMHHRGMSAVSPQDLVLNKGSCGDNKRKRASWDGGSR